MTKEEEVIFNRIQKHNNDGCADCKKWWSKGAINYNREKPLLKGAKK